MGKLMNLTQFKDLYSNELYNKKEVVTKFKRAKEVEEFQNYNIEVLNRLALSNIKTGSEPNKIELELIAFHSHITQLKLYGTNIINNVIDNFEKRMNECIEIASMGDNT